MNKAPFLTSGRASLLTGEQILAFVGVKSPSEGDKVWADLVARAITAGIVQRMNGAEITSDAIFELQPAALYAGGEGFKRREALFGLTGYADMQGNAIRIARDYLEGIRPIIDRYSAGPGIG